MSAWTPSSSSDWESVVSRFLHEEKTATDDYTAIAAKVAAASAALNWLKAFADQAEDPHKEIEQWTEVNSQIELADQANMAGNDTAEVFYTVKAQLLALRAFESPLGGGTPSS